VSALYAKLRETRGACALLESTASPSALAQRSLLARHPRAILVADGYGTRVTTAAGTRTHTGDPLDVLRELLAELQRRRPHAAPAVVGALAYDYVRPRNADPRAPRLLALAVDRLEESDTPDSEDDGAPLDAELEVAGEPALAPRLDDLAAHSDLTRDEYRATVRAVKEHIAAGDIYQANLSQRFRLAWPQGGLALYDALRTTSPAPFAGYFRVGGLEIVSASPERLLRVDGDALSTRPIAGTRPRARDAAADRALAVELLLSEKERAEHLMLVDLSRNDLGRVARVGSVHVDELMTVEDYSHVRHIVSNVAARLRPDRDALDALRALFPGGTITGVPKIRCMEILDALEKAPRGFYTGSLFYLAADGRLDANILIRTAMVAAGVAEMRTGGGIVADSDPEREYEETLHKAEGLRVAMARAVEYHPPRNSRV
jgi:anthranilate/para-aminobenzoate synthase component I